MDGSRFDELARSMAGNASRRWVARGLIGGALAGAAALRARGTAAQVAGPPGLPLGSPCAATSDCQQGAASVVVCADNGLSPETLNCVATEGGCCSSDDQCPGALLCRPQGGEICLNVCVADPGTAVARTALIDANIRFGPAFDAGIAGAVPGGATLTVFPEGYANGYVPVEYAGIRGFVFAELLG